MIRILKCGETSAEEILSRSFPVSDVASAAAEIIRNVRERGDEALREYTLKFDGVAINEFLVSETEIKEALEAVSVQFVEVLEKAAANIRRFHSYQLREGYRIDNPDGTILGVKITPIEKVGLYVPGGTAPYPSTVLMDAIPAKIAGCSEIIMVTPPQKNGKVDPSILAAAYVAGVDRIYKLGGAQAVAALAYGTETVPKVYKIVGPGNAYVAAAKKLVYGAVSIDAEAGPSEVLIISDGRSDPVVIAADLLAQAEHDVMSSAILITNSEKLASDVQIEIERQLAMLERESIARASIEHNGKIIITDSVDDALDIANEIAPEHLGLCVDEPFGYLDRVKNAGSIFLGRDAPEPLGDYYAGPNHTLPTGGTAKFGSPLSVDDFIKKSQYTFYTREALNSVSEEIALFARQEGLTGHARSVLSRKKADE
ncbi:MAG: histidinol dehydrogenase [Oscillospiraceae bacterium]|nr:histidinol dehydrogenase [Oscillospiraceae bacterium]